MVYSWILQWSDWPLTSADGFSERDAHKNRGTDCPSANQNDEFSYTKVQDVVTNTWEVVKRVFTSQTPGLRHSTIQDSTSRCGHFLG